MPLMLKIDGYPQSREALRVVSLATDIVGPNDAARYVGKEIAQTLSLDGPILIVRTALDSDTFESANDRFRYHDGMIGRAEVTVRAEPLLFTLLPGFKELYDERRITFGIPRSNDATSRERP
jgi:membrane fusion protein (multidrug efflux system)